MDQVCQECFAKGFLYGVLAAAIVGFLARRIFWALRLTFQAFQPQPIVHLTQRTPWQVLMTTIRGCILLVFWAVVAVVALGLLVWIIGSASP